MRLVDADALKAKAFGKRGGLIHTSDIDAMPTVDAVPVVRCKDCRFSNMTVNGECKYCDIWFPDEAEYMDGDYYCASGERKDGDGNG